MRMKMISNSNPSSPARLVRSLLTALSAAAVPAADDRLGHAKPATVGGLNWCPLPVAFRQTLLLRTLLRRTLLRQTLLRRTWIGLILTSLGLLGICPSTIAAQVQTPSSFSQPSPTPLHSRSDSPATSPTPGRFTPLLDPPPASQSAGHGVWAPESFIAPQSTHGTRPNVALGQDAYGAPLPPTQAGFPAQGFPAQGFPNSANPGFAGQPNFQGQAVYQDGGGFGFGGQRVDPNSFVPNNTAQIPGGSLSYFNSTPSILGQGSDFADIDVYAPEGQTGRFLFGGAYNSDAGLTGQIIFDERNFDIRRFPRNFRDVVEGRAFRGGGQRFRMELVPGNEVQRYLVSLTEPYLFDTNVSFGISGYYFNRRFTDWTEERLGGRLSLGYRLTPDLSISAAVRAENIDVKNPRVNTSPQLNSILGDTDLYVGSVTLTHDTRDHPFLPTEGRFLELALSQGFGEFDFPRADLDWRRYFLLYERPDRSGRHTVSVGSRLGFSGSDTPIIENYFAGGFSTMRGFDFRGASPVENGVVVGGRFQWLNTVEYTFPLTADDMVKGVAFVDFGTVEEDIELRADSFRVAPGLGLRIHMPAAGGGGAPLAFDFAVPLTRDETDDTRIFSFYVGLVR